MNSLLSDQLRTVEKALRKAGRDIPSVASKTWGEVVNAQVLLVGVISEVEALQSRIAELEGEMPRGSSAAERNVARAIREGMRAVILDPIHFTEAWQDTLNEVRS